MSDELNPSVKQYCQFQKNQYLANASICSIVTVQYPSTNCVGPPPWLLGRAALRSNATSPLGKGGYLRASNARPYKWLGC